jgi:predicted  nucleic acid-binding Zn-ribbon protein
MSEQKRRSSSFYISLFLLVIAVVTTAWAVLNRQYIYDQVRVSQFTPSSEVVSLRDNLSLTSTGTFLFDASHPLLQTANQFNDSCQQHKETNNPIIGCYVNDSIYIYKVATNELQGIEETTAAHELLHAVYQRLSRAEKTKLDAELKVAYERVKTPELEDRMKYYEKSEPGQEMDELHSILGTESINLGAALEDHYDDYFSSRKKIIAFHEAYSATFDRITMKMKDLETQINTEVASLNQRIGSYNQKTSNLNNDTNSFNQRSQTVGAFASQTQFNSERNALTGRKQALDAEYANIQATISEVESWRKSYNQMVDKYNQLSRSINSSLAPTPSL